MIRTVEMPGGVLAQGEYLGGGTVRDGDRTYHGKLVPTFRKETSA